MYSCALFKDILINTILANTVFESQQQAEHWSAGTYVTVKGNINIDVDHLCIVLQHI